MKGTSRPHGLLGMNARNLLLMNRREAAARRLVDDKEATKEALAAAGVAVPRTLFALRSSFQREEFLRCIGSLDGFVIKPSLGSQGKGILVIAGRPEGAYRTASGRLLSAGEVWEHAVRILRGHFSRERDDIALVEERLIASPFLERLSPSGLADIRVIVHGGKPVMAMLRLATSASGGKANLHQGGLGLGIDLEGGEVIGALAGNRPVDRHPDTGEPLLGTKVPGWAEIVATAVKAAACVELGYVGVDVAVDAGNRPVVMELNARPGLQIQAANGEGLADSVLPGKRAASGWRMVLGKESFLTFAAVLAGLFAILRWAEDRHEWHAENVEAIRIGAEPGGNPDGIPAGLDSAQTAVWSAAEAMADSGEWEPARLRLDSLAGAAGPRVAARLRLRMAERDIAAGRDASARKELAVALEGDPGLEAASLALQMLGPSTEGEGAKAAGDSTRGMDASRLEDWLEEHPDFVPGYFRLALSRKAENRPDLAEQVYRRILALRPTLKEARWNLGLLLLSQDRFREALPHFSALAKANPWKAEFHFNAARCLAHLDDLPAAAAGYRKAVAARGGNYPEAFFNLALCLRRQGHPDSAVAALEKALSLDPEYAEAWYNLGLIRLDLGDAPGAGRDFRRAGESRAGYKEAWYNLGLVESRLGRGEESRAAFRLALKADPRYAKARAALLRRYQESDTQDSIRILARAGLALDSTRADWLFLLAETLRKQDSLAAAEPAYRRFLTMEPDHFVAVNNLGLTLAKLNRREEALAVFERGVKAFPDNVAMRYNLALQLRMLGRWDEALRELDRVLRLDPDHAASLRLRAKAAARMTREAAAEKEKAR